MVKKLYKSNGFSLIELSIVLIVISFLIAAIVYGASLIKSAKVNALISEITNFRTSAAAFIEKYGEIPGDGSKIANNGVGGLTASDAGNNDGIIGSKDSEAAYFEQESYEFFKHLSAAKMINFDSRAPSGGNLTSLSDITINETYPGSKIGKSYFFYIDTSSVYDIFEAENKLALYDLNEETKGIKGDLMVIFIRKFGSAMIFNGLGTSE
ncbi:MAG: prepilin-type N-terminal cleavage/methylation domain-containing protein [Rickettsiales bacterium]|nr:prepilin-type N-terminal cleavage/methylation domain-containing protein [Rickettsiales bacterium]